MKKKRTLSFLLACFLLLFCLISCGAKQDNGKPYELIVSKGYSGTREEWIAALVGEYFEDHSASESKSAYMLATEKGYVGSFGEWTESIVGKASDAEDIPTYELAAQNGFEGDLHDWLVSISGDVSTLGHSEDSAESNYEIACKLGFDGDFIEWLISLVETK